VRIPPGAALLAALVLAAAPLAHAQTTLRRVRVLRDDTLHGVRSAAFSGSDLLVLDAPAPALHLYAGTARRAWGARGRGPAELMNPYNAVWAGGRILVRDSELQKLASYDRAGALVGTRPLAGMAVHLAMAGADTLVEWFGTTRTVARLRGARQDTVLRYTVDVPEIQLSAPGAPSLSLPAPYAPSPAWAALPDGRVAFWDGRENDIRVLDRAGRVAGRIAIPADRYPVTAQDREAWIASGIPESVRGERVFEPLRAAARTEVRFPRQLPPVMAMRAEPSGGVWVMQSGSAGGQRWARLAQGRAPLRIRLPAGERLLDISRAEIATLARDADGAERIHVYANPLRGAAARP
jgi:hypothetical protein